MTVTKNILFAAIAALILALLFVSNSHAATAKRHCQKLTLTPLQAIQCTFPKKYRASAWKIAKCESTANAASAYSRKHGKGRWAKNGQYIGIFQMGTGERKTYGWYSVGAPAIVQAAAARRLHKARGWSPWSPYGCKP